MRMNPAAAGAGTFGWPSPLLLLCLGAALLSAALVRAMIGVAVLDRPGHRSAHDRPIPKGGGVGVMVSLGLAVPLAGWLHGDIKPASMTLLLGGVALLALVSWLDDLRQFRPMLKLAAQIAAAALVLAAVAPLPGGLLGLTVGFAWLLFVTNALNFIDGLNGLAAGSMALAALIVGLGAPLGGSTSLACLLAAGLLGFLPFNFPNARIFLGDVGSQGAGLCIAALGLLRWDQAGAGAMLIMPLLLAGILYDVGFTLLRRLIAGDRLTEAHRGHLYQVAFRSGIAASSVALLHWGFVLWGGMLGALLSGAAVTTAMAILLAALPQLIWTAIVWRLARAQGLGAW